VWVGGGPPQGRKVGSIGVHVNRGVTTHGFAVNVNNDLQPFEWVIPCGIEGVRMTSICRELGAAQDLAAYMDVVGGRFCEIYDRTPVEIGAGELSKRVPGTDALAAAGPPAAHVSGNGEPASVR
jgi:lipoyl(octanoyl) transferase